MGFSSLQIPNGNPAQTSHVVKVFLQYQIIDSWASVWGFPEATAYDKASTPVAGLPKKMASIVEKVRKWRASIPVDLVEETFNSSFDEKSAPLSISAFRWGEDRSQDTILDEHLRFAENHSSQSNLHKICEQLHLMSYVIGSLSPVSPFFYILL